MTIPAAYAITADSLTAETFRQAPSSLLAGTGVVGSGDLAVSANGTPNMSVNVAAGQVWIPGTLSSATGFPVNLTAQTGYGLPADFNEQASYFGWNNGTVNLVISASDPTNPRIDLVVASIEDAQYSGASNQAVLQVITGTPAASPAAPAAPASSVVLAQVSVAAGATSITSGDITDERPFLTLQGPRTLYRSRMYRNGAWSLASAATIFGFDTVTFDPTTMYSTSTHQWTCPVDGYYRVSTFLTVDSSASGQRSVALIYHNGSQYSAQSSPYSSAASQFLTAYASDEIDCTAGDTLSVYQYGTSGLTGSTGASVFGLCEWVGY